MLAALPGIGSRNLLAAPPAGLSLIDSVRATLEFDPEVKLQQEEVAIAKGRVIEEKGRFDTRLSSIIAHELKQSRVPEGLTVVGTPSTSTERLVRLTENRTTYEVGLDKPFRSGVVAGPSIAFTRTDDNLSGFDPQNRADLNFSVVIPFGQGLGTEAVTARERAAKINHDAARLSFEHVIAQRVLNTALTYWNYVAAYRRQEILAVSEVRARDLLQNTSNLVQAAAVPQAELAQLTANLADKSRSSILATQELFEARQQLGLAMGVTFEEFAFLPPPSDQLPNPAEVSSAISSAKERLTRLAIERRADLQSSRRQADSARALLAFTKDNLKPQVDLTLRAGYGGYDQGSGVREAFTAYGDNIAGPNALAALRFAWPPANNAAKGRHDQQYAIYQQQLIRLNEVARSIQSSVVVALGRLESGSDEVAKSQLATNSFTKAVQHEQDKRRLGISTFNDVLLAEDRLTSAALENLRTQLRFANALVQLRFETGTIMASGPSGAAISLQRLTTVPSERDDAGRTPTY